MATRAERIAKVIVTRDQGVRLVTGESALSARVVPSRLLLHQGDTVIWELDAAGLEGDRCGRPPFPKFRVEPKQPGWPFGHPHAGDVGKPARSGDMRPDSAGRYQYVVTVWCPENELIVVDPDMDVME